MRALCARANPPGVVTYADGVPVGWCNIGARSENPRLVHSTVMRPVDPPGCMDLTMAFVGTKSMFERVGFSVIGVTQATASQIPRLVIRRTF